MVFVNIVMAEPLGKTHYELLGALLQYASMPSLNAASASIKPAQSLHLFHTHSSSALVIKATADIFCYLDNIKQRGQSMPALGWSLAPFMHSSSHQCR